MPSFCTQSSMIGTMGGHAAAADDDKFITNEGRSLVAFAFNLSNNKLVKWK